MSKYFKMMFELVALAVTFLGAINLLWNFLYAISF